MLLSDRDIRAELDSGRVGLDPLDPAMVQPASVDVRLDRFFRLFDNHRYAHIDPRQEQDELTRLVEVDPDEAFILHPGEFVLGSTYEVIGLSDGLASRLEGRLLHPPKLQPWGMFEFAVSDPDENLVRVGRAGS